MNWNRRLRQAHRILAMLFTATVSITVVVLALQGPGWVSYLPLLPLALLFFSGLYLYARPSVAARGGAGAAAAARRTASELPAQSPVAHRIRRLHRWAAVGFTVTVAATFVALSLPDPVVWVSYLPLVPLALLFFSGLYQFFLPYRGARRGGSMDEQTAAA